MRVTGASLVALLAVLTVAPPLAAADGFDARVFRPTPDPAGIGTLDGARAPESSTLVASVESDAQLRPIVYDQGTAQTNILRERVVIEPALMLGLGSGFAAYARAPFIAHDSGVSASSEPLSSGGIGSPSVGAVVPLGYTPVIDARASLRGEITVPVGPPDQFRGEPSWSGRVSLDADAVVHDVGVLLDGGVHLAPTRGIGDAQLGNAVIAGAGVRYPARAAVSVIASFETRLDLHAGSFCALGGAGLEFHLAATGVRVFAAAGIHDIIGTPTALFSLALLEPIRLGPSSSPPSAPPSDGPAPPPAPPPPAPSPVAALPPLPGSSVPDASGPGAPLLIAIPPILFAVDSAILDSDAVRGLTIFARRAIASRRNLSFRLVGHADETGIHGENVGLGLRRATAVRDLLLDLGLPRPWMDVETAADVVRARDEERTADDRLRDRRVEILVHDEGGE